MIKKDGYRKVVMDLTEDWTIIQDLATSSYEPFNFDGIALVPMRLFLTSI